MRAARRPRGRIAAKTAKIGAVPELDRPELDPTLADLADAFGIATEYWDWQGRHISVSPDTIVVVLAALDIDAATPEAEQLLAMLAKGEATDRRTREARESLQRLFKRRQPE